MGYQRKLTTDIKITHWTKSICYLVTISYKAIMNNENTSSDILGRIKDLKQQFSSEPATITDHDNSVNANSAVKEQRNHKKVSIIGCGRVGMAIAFALLNQEIAGTIVLYDRKPDKLDGEVKDLEQGSAFHRRVRVLGASEYSVTAGSHLVIITAGAAQKDGQSRLDLVVRNTEIMKSIIPEVLKYSPDSTICIVSNPCDILTAVAAKIAGPTVPPGRIFGSGTCLDSSRLQSLVAKGLDIDAQGVEGCVIGEHGDSSVPVWSSVRVGNLPLVAATGEQDFTKYTIPIHRYVVESAGDIIKKKGCTNWAVGLTAAHIATAVLNDMQQVMPVSTCVRGLYGIDKDVYLSLPCSIGAGGVCRVIKIPLTNEEETALWESANNIWTVQEQIWKSL